MIRVWREARSSVARHMLLLYVAIMMPIAIYKATRRADYATLFLLR